jgi:aspartate 1-decarboxylase
MFKKMLHGKIHRATVTAAELHYEGSITVAGELLEASGIAEYELVHVVNVNTGTRLETYTIAGKQGEICLNGAAARLGAVGDKVIIMAYADLTPDEMRDFKPKQVLVNEKNRVVQ